MQHFQPLLERLFNLHGTPNRDVRQFSSLLRYEQNFKGSACDESKHCPFARSQTCDASLTYRAKMKKISVRLDDSDCLERPKLTSQAQLGMAQIVLLG